MKVSKEIIKLVNIARKVLGLEPIPKLPKGIQTDPDRCPLGQVLQGAVTGSVTVVGKRKAKNLAKAWDTKRHGTQKSSEVDLPDALDLFVADFDNGKYPQLVTK